MIYDQVQPVAISSSLTALSRRDTLEKDTALPYIGAMQTVIWTATFLTQARKCGLSEEELSDIVTTIADNPIAGDLMAGTGGARKLRHAGRGKGKSGGYRTIHYFGGG
ncbi:type II toxin-antitoxin system RelE/ParE family toxin [Cohaesibacter celericrescens]|uniref:type II toxin-antitoxin system RelE/ParE family toxin n=1 Tax=Cohaesibacter celericrescens TaxID=2067669 RepID=UPI001FE15771|nr:type II toxin-antitoxin system RelE/ParE family toxin [Cohaesibacter celericrescens]